MSSVAWRGMDCGNVRPRALAVVRLMTEDLVDEDGHAVADTRNIRAVAQETPSLHILPGLVERRDSVPDRKHGAENGVSVASGRHRSCGNVAVCSRGLRCALQAEGDVVRALGLTIPPSVLLRADHGVE